LHEREKLVDVGGRRGWHDGDRVRVWQNVPARPAIVSFLLAYPHIYALLALRLSPQLLLSHRSFFSPDLPLVPTDGTSSWQPEVEEAAVPRSITRGAVWFARPHRVKKKTRPQDATFQIEDDNDNAAGRLKIGDDRARGNRCGFSRLELIRRDVHRARPTKKCISIGHTWRDVFLLREILFPHAIPISLEAKPHTDVSRCRDIQNQF